MLRSKHVDGNTQLATHAVSCVSHGMCDVLQLFASLVAQEADELCCSKNCRVAHRQSPGYCLEASLTQLDRANSPVYPFCAVQHWHAPASKCQHVWLSATCCKLQRTLRFTISMLRPISNKPTFASISKLIALVLLRHGDLEAAEDFIAIGRDVNEADDDGRTPLHYAVAFDKHDLLKALIGASANLEAAENLKNTPLHYACGYGRGQCVETLIDAGANVHATNASGKTGLDLVK